MFNIIIQFLGSQRQKSLYRNFLLAKHKKYASYNELKIDTIKFHAPLLWGSISKELKNYFEEKGFNFVRILKRYNFPSLDLESIAFLKSSNGIIPIQNCIFFPSSF